jgi:hypothetical protein
MSVAEIARVRSSAEAAGITADEWSTFKDARHSAALAFYITLRQSLANEYRSGKFFELSPHALAGAAFLPGRRDRKIYMRLRDELLRLGLLERVRAAGFYSGVRMLPALYRFSPGAPKQSGNVVSLLARVRLKP